MACCPNPAPLMSEVEGGGGACQAILHHHIKAMNAQPVLVNEQIRDEMDTYTSKPVRLSEAILVMSLLQQQANDSKKITFASGKLQMSAASKEKESLKPWQPCTEPNQNKQSERFSLNLVLDSADNCHQAGTEMPANVANKEVVQSEIILLKAVQHRWRYFLRQQASAWYMYNAVKVGINFTILRVGTNGHCTSVHPSFLLLGCPGQHGRGRERARKQQSS